MAKYQQYEEYKDSGVEWLGEIPSHWNLSSLKRCVDGCTNGIWGSEPEESSDNTVVLRVADFDRDKLEISEEKLTLRNISPKERENRLLRKGDLLIEKSGGGDKTLVGCVVLFDKDFRAVTSNFVAKMTPKINYESSFLKYAFSLLYDGRVNYASIKQTTGIQNLDSDAYLMEKFVFPEKEEQIQIANFLDHETAQIDTLIEKQQTLIQLLKEKRQAVISHAVTKGLNPDAPMKDSGVEWLGEVPEHWEVLPAKRFFKLVAEPAASNNDYELLSVYTAIGVRPRKDLEQKGNKASTTDGYWKVERGDIVVNKLLAWMGAVGYSDYEGVTSPAYDILRATKDINSKFYHYLFRTRLANMEFKRWSRGIMEMRLRLYFDELGRIFMPLPSKQEQDLIVKKIEKMDNQFDDLIKKSEYNIKLMQERRTALISAAVTGKIDVRGWQAHD